MRHGLGIRNVDDLVQIQVAEVGRDGAVAHLVVRADPGPRFHLPLQDSQIGLVDQQTHPAEMPRDATGIHRRRTEPPIVDLGPQREPHRLRRTGRWRRGLGLEEAGDDAFESLELRDPRLQHLGLDALPSQIRRTVDPSVHGNLRLSFHRAAQGFRIEFLNAQRLRFHVRHDTDACEFLFLQQDRPRKTNLAVGSAFGYVHPQGRLAVDMRQQRAFFEPDRPLSGRQVHEHELWIVDAQLHTGLGLPAAVFKQDFVEPGQAVGDVQFAVGPVRLERRDIDVLRAPSACGNRRVQVEILHGHLDLGARPAVRHDRRAGHARHRLQGQRLGGCRDLRPIRGQVVPAAQLPSAAEHVDRIGRHLDGVSVRLDPHGNLDSAHRLLAKRDVLPRHLTGQLDSQRLNASEDVALQAPLSNRPPGLRLVGTNLPDGPVGGQPNVLESPLAEGQSALDRSDSSALGHSEFGDVGIAIVAPGVQQQTQ